MAVVITLIVVGVGTAIYVYGKRRSGISGSSQTTVAGKGGSGNVQKD